MAETKLPILNTVKTFLEADQKIGQLIEFDHAELRKTSSDETDRQLVLIDGLIASETDRKKLRADFKSELKAGAEACEKSGDTSRNCQLTTLFQSAVDANSQNGGSKVASGPAPSSKQR